MTAIVTAFRQRLIRTYEGGLKRRRTFAYYGSLGRTQWLPADELAAFQVARLRTLLQHAWSNSPYYRETWMCVGLRPDGVERLDDFRCWPIVGRETIRQHRTEMRSRNDGQRLIAKSTGGSSGVPLQFDLNADSNDRRMAASHRGYSWAGAAPGTRQLYLWGVPLGELSRIRRWKEDLYHRLYRHKVLNCFEFRDDRAADFIEAIKRYRPEAIVAYTNPLYSLARAIEEQGLAAWRPESIIVGAEKLHDFQRELIERVFQAPVFETYGSREFMLIGAECDRHEGLHLTMEHLLVEVLDDDGQPTPDGEEGNVVITDLYNYGMPFIRYANGDRAIAGFKQCSCGRGLPLLTKVVGRRLDMLTTPDGRHVPGEFFPHLLKDFPGVRRFQVVQDSPDSIELRLVLGGGWSGDDQTRLENQIRQVTGEAVELRLNRVNDIPLTSAGKLQVVINRCHARERGIASCSAASREA